MVFSRGTTVVTFAEVECVVDHIYEDGSGLRRIVSVSVAEAIWRMTCRGVVSTVFGLSRKRSTYMIVLSRWNAIVCGFVETGLIGRIPSWRFFGGCVAGLAVVSSRGAPR